LGYSISANHNVPLIDAEGGAGERGRGGACGVVPHWYGATMITVDEVRAVALPLPRTIEVLIRDRIKFRVGQIVYVAFSRDETLMGFGFPKDEREALVEAEPLKFLMPTGGDLRYHWVIARLDAIDHDEMRELVIDAWRMVVPKKVAREHLGG
jgi:hypothetical protein